MADRRLTCGFESVFAFNSYFLSDDIKTMRKEEHHKRLEQRDVRLFSKTMLLFPCHEDYHWSLFVVINPGLVESKANNACCIIHFDSLAHMTNHKTSQYTRKLCDFLNGQWQIEKANPLQSPFKPRAPNMSIKPKGEWLS